MSIASVAPHRPRPISASSTTSNASNISTASLASIAPAAPVLPTVSFRSMLRTMERVLLREGGHQRALVNARSAVLEGEARAAVRADARASLQRLAAPVE